MRDNHEYYVRLIEHALAQKDQIRNIAVTGGYGVGKSSVLQRIASLNENTVIKVSLSTLGLAEGDPGGDNSTTNRIQKEIVKQLLYRERPAKMRGSRFHRLGRFDRRRGLVAALLGGPALWLGFFVSGWAVKLATLFRANELGLRFQLALLGVLIGATYCALALAHNRLAIKGFKVATADIALASADTTYFDQYLDEIIYFFEVTRRDIVIFEDIDRYDDPHIFETLRALNTLLNASNQIRGDIRFIYAIKDSIFALLGVTDAGDEIDATDRPDHEFAPSNRTKFFDLVVPIVPFITHRNARELVGRVMSDLDVRISRELIDLCSRYMPDMRLVKNIHNEFIVFRRQVAVGRYDALSDDGLFAMMLYKNIHLTDFERIPRGNSRLDSIYDASRNLVRERVAALDAELARLSRQLSNLDSTTSKSADLGDHLGEYLARIARHLNLPSGAAAQITFGGGIRNANQFGDPELWRAIAAAGPTESMVLRYANANLPQGQLTLTKADLTAALGDSLTLSDWDTSARDQIVHRRDAIATERAFLLHARYVDLLDRPDLVQTEAGDFGGVLDKYLGDGLARELVEAGYIDQNFALYTSNYYADRVSVNALNFLLHNVDRDVMDVDYVLSTDDVKAILDERGTTILQDQCALNVSLLDELLGQGDARVDLLLRMAARKSATPEGRTFWTAYLAGGKQVTTVVSRLAASWQEVLTFLVGRKDLDEQKKTELIDLALTNLEASVNYAVNTELRVFLEDAYPQLRSLTAEKSANRAEAVVALLVRAGVHIKSLALLTDSARNAVVTANAYELSAQNLPIVAGNHGVALDQLRITRRGTYDYVVENVDKYLEALSHMPDVVSIETGDEFPEVLSDLALHHAESLEPVIVLANASAIISDLARAPIAAWSLLADNDRFPATYENVMTYFDGVGTIDTHLGAMLVRAGALDIPDDTDQAARTKLGLQLLAARDAIPDPKSRVSLAASLSIESVLPAANIQPENGPLAGLLLEFGLVADDEASFALVNGRGWETCGPFIEESKQFPSYMSPALVPVALIAGLLTSAKVDDAVKDKVLDSFEQYLPTDDVEALAAVAEYALARRRRLDQPQLLRISSSGVSAELATNLVALSITGMTFDDLKPIAEAIGGLLQSLFTRDGQRPRIENNEANRTIVEHLKSIDEVSSVEKTKRHLDVQLKSGD